MMTMTMTFATARERLCGASSPRTRAFRTSAELHGTFDRCRGFTHTRGHFSFHPSARSSRRLPTYRLSPPLPRRVTFRVPNSSSVEFAARQLKAEAARFESRLRDARDSDGDTSRVSTRRYSRRRNGNWFYSAKIRPAYWLKCTFNQCRLSLVGAAMRQLVNWFEYMCTRTRARTHTCLRLLDDFRVYLFPQRNQTDRNDTAAARTLERRGIKRARRETPFNV